ncbi:MAG TPA: AI-2E family transporter [Negativicutes bacterium]|nr:AI-2E family transporter [Negativicutes bacterium]
MNYQKYQIYFLLAFLTGMVILVFLIFRPFIYVLALAMIFTWFTQPVYQAILPHVRRHEGIAALATIVITAFLILLPLVFLGMQIFQEVNHVYASLSANGTSQAMVLLESRINDFKQWLPAFEGISLDPNQYLKQGVELLALNLGFIFSSFAKLTVNSLIFLFALYYFLKDGYKLKKAVMAMSPLDDSDDEAIINKLEKSIDSVLRGSLVIAIIQGLVATLGFMIFGVPNAILWGSATMVVALVPGVGTALVMVPAVLFLFFSGKLFAALGLLIWGVIAVGLIDNFLGPKLLGRGAQLHPLLVMLSVLGGIGFFGPIGLLLGPIAMSLLLALIDIYLYILKKYAMRENAA